MHRTISTFAAVTGVGLLLHGGPATAQVLRPLGAVAQYSGWIPLDDDAIRAIGLPPLSTVKLTEGWREARLWVTGPGPVLVSRMVRVVQTPDSVFGEVYQWWMESPIHRPPEAPRDSQCQSTESRITVSVGGPDPSGPFPAKVTACLLHGPPTDWATFVERLDELGAWELDSMEQVLWTPDGVRIATGADGTGLTGETLRGQRYHAFHWWQPKAGDGVASAAARELIDRVFTLERAASSGR